MTATIPLDAPKSDTYYGLARADVVALLPQPVGRVLDVGCGAGGANQPLRDAGATWITGIEILPEPAKRAESVYEQVLVGDAVEQVAKADGPFNTIICYDVLEHLYDPLALVTALAGVAAPGAHIHVSVPNASHVTLLRDLILHHSFNYQPFGHRDATHIRWFTRTDITQLVAEGGWQIAGVTPSNLMWKSRTLAKLTRNWTTEFLAGQWFVLGRLP